MKRLSMGLTVVMLVICAGTAFIAFSEDGLFGGLVRGAGNVATSAAATVVDAPQRIVEGEPLIQREHETYPSRWDRSRYDDDMVYVDDEEGDDEEDYDDAE